MAESVMDALDRELSPVVATLGLDLVDVEVSAGAVKVTVDRDGGVDLDALADANKAVSAALDRIDPLPGRYTLEVSSPGLERKLRTPAQFVRAVGETVSVRLVPETGDARRLRARLAAADERGVVLEGPEVPEGSAAFTYDTIQRARTVFEWGPPATTPGRPKAAKGRERARTR